MRVVRACRDLGIASVAIHSEADRDALHVRLADEAWPCGPAPARESYLAASRIVEIAKRTGADAVHPGYGFLSESGDFADAVTAAGLVFVGPDGDVMRRMGDKVTSRRAMQEAGVPIVPGATERLDDAAARALCAEIGFPVMVKASAGGGGRGLRRVDAPDRLDAALERARSEAKQGFGDDGLYVEKVVDAPRHVEVQVLADAHGDVVHVFERECSIQRRHQKLVEEAPANVSPELRAALGEAAVAAARAVGYRGAGTVEFLVDADDRFYFLEMNTRIQVEHPITEAVTGVDLVAEGLRVAAGEPLSFRQEDLALRGHAIEARIYAEDPAKGFLPSPGPLAVFRPPDGPGIRVDAGVEAGSAVTPHYDALLAKLVAWGSDREQALARLDRALSETLVAGVRTSIPFHRWLLRQPGFRAARYDTTFVDAGFEAKALATAAPEDAPVVRALAAFVALGREAGRARVGLDGVETRLALTPGEDALRVEADAGSLELRLSEPAPGLFVVGVEGRTLEAAVAPRARGIDVMLAGACHACRVEPEEA